jgi:hypothetical protein
VIGVPVRVHDMFGSDLGIAHVPPPVRIGDLVALERAVVEIYDIVDTEQTRPIGALVKVRPVRLAITPR